MANSTTNLDVFTSSDDGIEARVLEFQDAASQAAAFGRHGSACSALNFAIYGGNKKIAGVPTFISNTSFALTPSATNYIRINADGTFTVTTSAPSGWPGPLASDAEAVYAVVTGASTVTSYTDYRAPGGGSTLTDAMVFKGVIDCSANPNYPAADAGDVYKISVAGKIGGASGANVEVGDTIYCITDGSAAGTQAAVGANWVIAQVNVDGQVVGPASATDGQVALFDGTTGKLLKVGTAAAVTAFLNAFVGDSGAGGTKGMVPAPAAGDAAAGKYLKADGTFAVPPGGGAVSSVSNSDTTLTISPTTGAVVASLNLARSNTWTKAQGVTPVALTDGANIAVDASLSNNFTVTLGGNRTLDNPTNLVGGFIYNFYIEQDATGTRTLAYGSKYKFPGAVKTVSIAASAKDLISCLYDATDDVLLCTLAKAFS